MFMEFYSMEKKYCSTLLERDTSSFSQAIFVTYEHVLMMIVLLIMMTGYYFDILSTQRSKIDWQYSLDQGGDRWLYYYMGFCQAINSCFLNFRFWFHMKKNWLAILLFFWTCQGQSCRGQSKVIELFWFPSEDLVWLKGRGQSLKIHFSSSLLCG